MISIKIILILILILNAPHARPMRALTSRALDSICEPRYSKFFTVSIGWPSMQRGSGGAWSMGRLSRISTVFLLLIPRPTWPECSLKESSCSCAWVASPSRSAKSSAYPRSLTRWSGVRVVLRSCLPLVSELLSWCVRYPRSPNDILGLDKNFKHLSFNYILF